jgi:hypothetical protein
VLTAGQRLFSPPSRENSVLATSKILGGSSANRIAIRELSGFQGEASGLPLSAHQQTLCDINLEVHIRVGLSKAFL